ncbi:hypothetical protein SK803_22380 [Lentzea sp. BCCO 10_0856]|uniref:Uncharacterized protein n=1 Tax=Lentzea miocenica TaxID=3095431 RepID=A0ABU4T485_9PSEU|nr:hypothetical protein [Lentzea sp. BCCO 10_0856]MDX8032975.1 hypothetical protein [Lentzea sp. BCCO 10_0856]
MIVERQFKLAPLTDEMLTRVQRYANLSPDEALAVLVKYGFVAYRMTVLHQFGMDPNTGSLLDLPEHPDQGHQPE